jgi:hypothetical protein
VAALRVWHVAVELSRDLWLGVGRRRACTDAKREKERSDVN